MKRIIPIETIDHGLLWIPCPSWCIGRHEAGEHRADITHLGPEHTLDVASLRGPARLLTFALEQRPFTRTAPGRQTFINTGIEGDWYPQNPAGLRQFADSLRLHAASIEAHADVLDELNGGPR